jgi:hypothetical protein
VLWWPILRVAIFSTLNPASPAFEEKYTLGLGYASGGDLLKAQITDTKSSALGGGIAYTRKELKGLNAGEDTAQGNFGRSEVVIPISLMSRASDSVALGVTARHQYWRPLELGLPSQAWWVCRLRVGF